MPLSEAQVKSLVESPCLGAVVSQACALIQALERITEEEYLGEACRIRDVFLCIADYVLEQLWELHDPADPFALRGAAGSSRMRDLARVVHQLYAWIRYLSASSPRYSPPGIQVALARLAELHFPETARERPICLVRPQWKYNLTYVPVTWHLRALISRSVFDPAGRLGVKRPEQILTAIWGRGVTTRGGERRNPTVGKPPKQIAILSFAGLDTNDALVYPLLAHELGHFIDYSRDPPLHLSVSLRRKSRIRAAQIRKVLHSNSLPANAQDVNPYLNNLIQLTFVTLREILADLLATRILGFGFFAAQAEFLKNLAAWAEPMITRSGYPGIKFRLSVIFHHMVTAGGKGNIREFLRCHEGGEADKANRLLAYLRAWEAYLGPAPWERPPGHSAPTSLPLQQQLLALVENAVLNTLDALVSLAEQVVPDDRCARLTSGFFDRIAQLTEDLPPSLPEEEPNCFAELMAAAWAYQLLYGKEREFGKGERNERLSEYGKTCRLVSKAIELIRRPDVSRRPGGSAGEAFSQRDVGARRARPGVLCGRDIASRLGLPVTHRKHLGVIPLVPGSIQAASLDVHLGNWFVVARRTKLGAVEIGDKSDEQLLMTVGREELFVEPPQTFLIHPGDLVLGATLEFLALPNDVMAFVEGKSRLGRMGLIVATATQVAPGFHGIVVLEMANAGTVPLKVRPGMAIAQLVLQVMTNPVPQGELYRGSYYCQIKP